jgi:transposase-like protein
MKKAKSENPKRSKSLKPAASSADVGATTSAESPAKASNAPAGVNSAAPAARTVRAKKPKAAAKPAKPAKPARKRAARKVTKRYSPEAKAEILQFVRNHDSAKGRGGKSAAVREFGVSALTLSNWLKASKAEGKPTKARPDTAGRIPKSGKGGKTVDAGVGGIEKTLKRMLEIRNQIGALKTEFEALKARI